MKSSHVISTVPYSLSKVSYLVVVFLYKIYLCYNHIVGTMCTSDGLSMNSKCYRKFHNETTWFSASNDCLSHGGSLAVFTDTGKPSDNSQLIRWLNSSSIGDSYWIGLVISWWKTENNSEFELFYRAIHMHARSWLFILCPSVCLSVPPCVCHSMLCDKTGAFVISNWNN